MDSERKKAKSMVKQNITSSSIPSEKNRNKSNMNDNTRGNAGATNRVNTAGRQAVSTARWVAPRPKKAFITKGLQSRRVQSAEFAYDLSHDENQFARKFPGPMKDLSHEERQLQQSGARTTYLNTRYEHFPERKYNFPEATSWRIGWFHSLQQTK